MRGKYAPQGFVGTVSPQFSRRFTLHRPVVASTWGSVLLMVAYPLMSFPSIWAMVVSSFQSSSPKFVNVESTMFASSSEGGLPVIEAPAPTMVGFPPLASSTSTPVVSFVASPVQYGPHVG